MWYFIGIMFILAVFLWGICAGTREDDTEAQQKAIEEWLKKKGRK